MPDLRQFDREATWPIQAKMEVRLAELRAMRWKMDQRRIADNGDVWIEPGTEVRPIALTYDWDMLFGFRVTVKVRPVDAPVTTICTMLPRDLEPIDG